MRIWNRKKKTVSAGLKTLRAIHLWYEHAADSEAAYALYIYHLVDIYACIHDPVNTAL